VRKKLRRGRNVFGSLDWFPWERERSIVVYFLDAVTRKKRSSGGIIQQPHAYTEEKEDSR